MQTSLTRASETIPRECPRLITTSPKAHVSPSGDKVDRQAPGSEQHNLFKVFQMDWFHKKRRMFVLALLAVVMVLFYIRYRSPAMRPRAKLVSSLFDTSRAPPSDLNEPYTPTPDMLYDLTTDVDVDRKIDQLQLSPMPFLPNFKNPCWYESLPAGLLYQQNPYTRDFPVTKKALIGQMSSVLTRRLEAGYGWRLRCLPYFYIPGVAKSGTTDIFHALSIHPEIKTATTKEPNYWNRVRYNGTEPLKNCRWDDLLTHMRELPTPRPFSHYVDLFDKAADEIRKSVQRHKKSHQDYHHLITGEASVSYMYDFDVWRTLDVNKGLSEPKVTVAHLIHSLNPNSKIIFALRDPTERLFSAYKFFGAQRDISLSTNNFHTFAVSSIDTMEECLSRRSVRSCIYDKNTIPPSYPVGIREGMYQPFLADWLELFQRKNVFITRFEDYEADRHQVMDSMYEFLEIEPFRPKKTPKVQNRGKVPPGLENGMLEETRTLLNNFYKAWNHGLADMLGDKRFTWGL